MLSFFLCTVDKVVSGDFQKQQIMKEQGKQLENQAIQLDNNTKVIASQAQKLEKQAELIDFLTQEMKELKEFVKKHN